MHRLLRRRTLPLAGPLFVWLVSLIVPYGATAHPAAIQRDPQPVASPSGSLVVAEPAFRVRWADVTPLPLSGQRSMRFSFAVSGAQGGGRVLARISDLVGQQVRELSTGSAILSPEGVLRWDGTDVRGEPVDNGVYSVQLIALTRTGEERPSGLRRVRVERPTRTKTVYRVNGAGRRVALTFDDCNFDDTWNDILDTLEEHRKLATFFCLGKDVQLFPRVARRTVEMGNDIGSHSFAHPNMRYLSMDRILDELDRSTRSWWSVAGVTPIPYFRPPYGDFDADVLRGLGMRGYPSCVLWDVDPSDWTDPGPSVITSRVLSRVRPGSIVLLHVKPQTATALPEILKGLRRMKLKPVTLTELFTAGELVTFGDVMLPY